MAEGNPKSFKKANSIPSVIGPKYRTSDHFKAGVFSGYSRPKQGKIGLTKIFRTQHKG